MNPQKKIQVTVGSEITEFQTSTIEVPDEFLSWPTEMQKGFLDAKVSESLRANDSQEHTPRQGVRVMGAILNGRKILGEFPIQPDVSAAGRALLQAISYARAGQSDLVLRAMEESCRSLKVSTDTVGVLMRALNEAVASESAPKNQRPRHGLDSAKTTITDLQKDIEKALSGQVTVRRVPYGLAIGTLLDGPDDDRIGFYVAGPDASGRYRLTDNGQFLRLAAFLEKEGSDPTDEARRQTVKGILEDGGVLYDEKTGELVSAQITRSEVVEACRHFTDLLVRLRGVAQEEVTRTLGP